MLLYEQGKEVIHHPQEMTKKFISILFLMETPITESGVKLF
jgi:hypothetical protein